MKKLKTIAELVRTADLILIAGVVIVGGYFVIGSLRINIFIAATSAALIAAGGYAFNDWHDEQVDRINKPDRPIPSGRLSKGQALTISVILQALGFSLGLFLNLTAITLALVWIVLVNLYSLLLQDVPVVGNATTASMLATTFVYGGLAVGSTDNIWSLVMVIFLGNVSREIIKDIEDLSGDSLNDVKTFPGLIGVARAAIISSILFVVSIAFLFDTRLINDFNAIYFWLISLVVAPMTVVLAIRCIQTQGTCAPWASRWSKAIFGVMLVAVACGMVNDTP